MSCLALIFACDVALTRLSVCRRRRGRWTFALGFGCGTCEKGIRGKWNDFSPEYRFGSSGAYQTRQEKLNSRRRCSVRLGTRKRAKGRVHACTQAELLLPVVLCLPLSLLAPDL